MGIPAVTKHVTEFVAELVGEFAPIVRPNVDDDPRDIGLVVMEPYRWLSARVLVYTNFAWLSVGEQSHARKADLSHSRENAEHGVGRRRLPVAGQFQ